MKKFSTLLLGGFLLLLTFVITNQLEAQTTHPEQFNFTELAKYELEHGLLFKCKTCPGKEVDGGWKFLETDRTIPAGGRIMNQATPIQNTTTPNIINAVSPAPAQNFLGHIDAGTGIPPDTHGAVGLNHVVTATNDFVIVHNKVGGAEISRVSLGTFFQNTGVFDPYLILDPYTNRFIFTAQTGPSNGRIFLAISNTPDPTGTWTRQNFLPVSATVNPLLIDHPYVGTDNKWITISLRKFTGAGGFGGTMLHVLDKTSILAGNPIALGTNAQMLEKDGNDGDAPLPVTAYGLTSPANTIYILNAWDGSSSRIRLSTVTGNIPTMAWNTTTPAFPTGGTPWRDNPSNNANFVPQLGETRLLQSNDSRISCGVMVNGNIWCAHHIGLPFTAPDHLAVQWWQLSTSGVVLQRGRIDNPGIFRWFPSIAVNQADQVLIGYSISSSTTRVSAAYSTRSISTAANTTDDEFIYKTGLSTYWKDFNSGRARWGDYSHSALDPATNTLWTIQEYADQRTGTPDNSSRFGVWWAEVGNAVSLIARDAALSQILNPVAGASYCNVPITPRVRILNAGTDTLKSVQVGVIMDGINLGSNTFTNLGLVQFASTTVDLTIFLNPPGGTHTLKIFTFNPNGLADQRTSNDTSTITFSIVPTLTLPYLEGFESPTFPPANWTISNPDGGITWQRTTAAAKTGVASMWIDGWDYGPGAEGAIDIYKSPRIDITKLDTLTVNFDVAYARYTDFPADDTLEVVYSLDCGLTWLPTGYKKWGAALATAPPNNTALFVPTTSQWRNETVKLTNFCNIPSSTITLGIKFVNEFGQALYIDNLSLIGAGFQRNIAMNAITQPNDICNNSFSPVVSFTNLGSDTIYTAKINYSVDGGAVSTFNYSGTLPKCSTQVVTLPSITAANGAHVITIYSSDPNGLPDQFPANDTAKKAFNVSTTVINSPVSEGFENAAFPPVNWFVNNPDGSLTWERTTAAAKTGAASMVIRNFNYPTAGTTDRFFSAIIAPAQNVDSFFVSFDYAYSPGASYPGSTVIPLDTLEVQITQDCGATYTTIWKKWGEDLQTIGGANGPNQTSGTAFVPGAAQWKNVRLYVSPVIRNQNFQVHFVARSNKQNNLYVDNINIFSQILPQRLKNQGYLLYPSPFRGSFRIHHFQPPVDLQNVGVYNSVGQKVWEKNVNGQANTEMFVDLGKLAAGVYIVKLQYLNRNVVERIVKL